MKQIVKNLVSVLMMMAMAVVCVTSFTSCGGDDDEIGITPVNGGGTETVDIGYDYVIPCTNWGASMDEVRKWMTGGKFEEAADLTNEIVLGYRTPDKKYGIIYYFDGNVRGLSLATVYYNWYNLKDFEAWKTYTEKMYKVTLEEQKTVENELAYACNTYINGIWCAVGGYTETDFNHFVAVYGVAEK